MRPSRVLRCLLLVALAALTLAGCARRQAAYYAPAPAAAGGPYVPAGAVYGAQGYAAETPYNLDTGDRVRISVFGQDGVSNAARLSARGEYPPAIAIAVSSVMPG